MRLFGPLESFFAAALVSLLAFASNAAETSEGPYPVWWEPVIGIEPTGPGVALNSLEHIEDHLTGKLPNARALTVYKDGETGGQTALIDSCASYDKLTDAGYYNQFTIANHTSIKIGVYCQILKILGQATPAERSFMHDFVFDENTLAYLPAMVGSTAACFHVCRQYYANAVRVSLARTLGEGAQYWNVKSNTRLVMSYEERGRVLSDRITLIARGDFNHDGLEDLLIRSDMDYMRGGAADVFVVTRDAPDSVLYVLNPEQHLCSAHSGDYRCNPETHDISEWRDSE